MQKTRTFKYAITALTVWLAVAFGSVVASDSAGQGGPPLAERQQLSERGTYAISLSRHNDDPDFARTLALAMGVPAEHLVGARLVGPHEAAGQFPGLGGIEPRLGGEFTVLSTGVAGSSQPRPGTDLSHAIPDGNRISLVLELDPPSGARHLSFQYQFLTAEFPEFVGLEFDDRFSAWVTDSDGTRQIALASVNSTDLAPVSASLAGGSGFDLFAEQPGQLEGKFSHGLPAAGTTGWQQVRTEIAQQGPITLEFHIEDGGDNLLDSAVILDRLSLSAIAPMTVGPNPTTSNLGDALACIFEGGIVEGAVADGVTPIFVHFFGLPGPGIVEYSFAGAQAPEDGGWDQPGGSQRLNSIVVSTSLGQVGWESVAQYLVPEEFNRGGDEGLAQRFVTMQVLYIPDDPNQNPAFGQLPFRLLRPPLVLMHGLWSNPADAWGGSPLLADNRLRPFLGNYQSTNASHFSVNLERPAQPIREACEATRGQGIAITQVDYVGHSMGGILGRNFESLHGGLINKFFTINTPHTGSPLGNLVVAVRNGLDSLPFSLGEQIIQWLADNGLAIDQGALDDLSTGSNAIAAIQATPIPSHALVGIGGSDLVGDGLALVPGKLGVLFKILNFLDDTTDLFAGIQHDFVVGRRSQEGGMPASAITVFDGFDSIHTRAPKNPAYTSRIIDLLNSPATGTGFGQFPAPATLSTGVPQPATTRSQSSLIEAASGDGIRVSVPPDGSVFAPGQTFEVAVEAVGDFDLERALVISRIDAVPLDEAPFSGQFTIPENFLGALELSALGADPVDNFALSGDPVTILVETDLALLDLSIIDRDIAFFDAAPRQMHVVGTFADGIVRDLTHPVTGTIYQSANPDIVTVSDSGLLSPVNEGVTTVVVQNGGLQDSVSVNVVTLAAVPPEILAIAANPDRIWPPNRTMVPVEISVEVVEQPDDPPLCEISNLTSNEEPIEGDFVITGALSLELRAWRFGKGDGRIYTIEVTCTNSAGSAQASTEVTVPHDQR